MSGKAPRGLRPGPFLNLYVVSLLVAELYRRELEALGLKQFGLGVLHLIWLNQPVTPTELEALSGGRPTTVRDVVNDLVERGYVVREPNPADRRSQLLAVTEEGDRVSRLGMRATEGVRRRLKPHLPWPIDELDPRFEELIEALRAALTAD